MSSKPSILYESFNARFLTYKEIANTFIVNDHFRKLIQNNSSLLMGPRGCGKTTLLKMLSLPSLYEYDRLFDANIKNQVPFRSIYIPTDIQWNKQIEVLEKTIQDKGKVKLISQCTMTITVLQSLCNTFLQILHFELGYNEINEAEIELSKQLIDNWNLPKPIVPTLKSIEIALIKMISDLNSQINKHLLFGTEIQFEELYYKNFFDLLKLGCETFVSVLKVPEKKWALSFDELEIAPDWLQEELIESLRSRDQNYIFKLTTAPVVKFYHDVDLKAQRSSPSEGNDFNVIKIWTSDQKDMKDWRLFCETLMKKKIEKMVSPKFVVSPKDIFGESYLDLSIKDKYPSARLEYERDDYQENTPSWYAFKQLAKVDKSFEIFLRLKSIDPENPVPRNSKQVDEVFRKIKQIVIFRLHLRKQDDRLRSRKVIPLYYGLNTVFEFCDGNPRIFIGLMDEFLNLALTKDGQFRVLSINEQSRILFNLSERYLKILSSHPEATIKLAKNNYNIADLIDKVAGYIYKKSIVERFVMDQVDTFVVDDDLSNKLMPLIEFGLYVGAFVYIGPVKSLDRKGILNRRFRLTYALSPYFKLIPRTNNDIPLSRILNETTSQQSLFAKL